MQDHNSLLSLRNQPASIPLDLPRRPMQVTSNLRRLTPNMTPIKRLNDLCEDSPDKFFRRIFPRLLESFDNAAQITATAVFHVDVEFLRLLEVFAVEVRYDVGMVEGGKDVEFCGELFSFFGRHLEVGYFFSAKNLVEDEL